MIELTTDTRERLLALFAQFPPLAIRTDAQLDAVRQVVDGLLDREELDDAENLYLDLLGTLIYIYEETTVTIPPV